MGKLPNYMNIESYIYDKSLILFQRNTGGTDWKLERLVYLQGVGMKRVKRREYRNGVIGGSDPSLSKQ